MPKHYEGRRKNSVRQLRQRRPKYPLRCSPFHMNPDDILQTKLLKLFPDPEKRSAAEAELRRYGTESYENEPARVRLAVLKISGGDLDRIRRNIATAK